jgi:choline dehydrogenase-like flavoprotein
MIAGAGPAGISLAVALVRRGIPVVMIPGGGRYEDQSSRMRKTGLVQRHPWPHESLDEHRRFAEGGAGDLWGGRCVLLDRIDFHHRPWVPHSGWPIDYDEYLSWLPEASEILKIQTGLGTIESTSPMWPHGDDKRFDESTSEFWSPVTKFSDVLHRELLPNPNFTIIEHSWVSQINFSDSRSVELVIVEGPNGRVEFKPKFLILATGTIENTRLLLESGLDQNLPALGKFYMSHFWFTAPTFSGRLPLGDGVNFRRHEGTFQRRRWRISDELQLKEKLGNCSAFVSHSPIDSTSAHLDLHAALMRLKNSRRFFSALVQERFNLGNLDFAASSSFHRDLALVLRQLPKALFIGFRWIIVPRRFRPPLNVPSHKNGTWTIWAQTEHFPNPESSVTLSENFDYSGRRLPLVSIAFSDSDFQSAGVFYRLLSNKVRQLGYVIHDAEPITPASLRRKTAEVFNSNAHQAGTTRMGHDLGTSVVDENLKLHGSENCFVLGASVFPTFGHANPTLSVVMLACRLGEYLAGQFGNRCREAKSNN